MKLTDEQKLFNELTVAVRQADALHKEAGGGTRHWLRDAFLPALEGVGLKVVWADRIAALATVTAERNEAFSVGTALKGDLAMAREKALRQAESIADNVARLEVGMSRRDGYMAASDIEHRIAMVRTEGRAAQPEPEAEPRTFPMTDGPDIPWSLAEQIHKDEAFEWFYPCNVEPLEDQAASGGWAWREIADAFDAYGIASAEMAEEERKQERGAEAYHAAQEGERP